MFQTHTTWEAKTSHVLGELFFEPGVRNFHCIELPLNLPLFHVDVGQYVDGSLAWSRYQVMEFSHLEQFLELNDDFVVRVHLQTRRTNALDYQLDRISEIFSGIDSIGQIAYFYVTMDGKVHPDFRWNGTPHKNVEASLLWEDSSAELKTDAERRELRECD